MMRKTKIHEIPERQLSKGGKVILAAVNTVLDWYCHSDAPPPPWARISPYKEIVASLPQEICEK